MVLFIRLDEAQRRTVRYVKWSHCGRLLAATSFDATTAIWRRIGKEQFELAAILEGHENEVKGVAWNRADNLLATSSRDKVCDMGSPRGHRLNRRW